MMGNTYATVIEKSEKEFLKQVSRTDIWDERVAQELRHRQSRGSSQLAPM
jgi:hypothetical protein